MKLQVMGDSMSESQENLLDGKPRRKWIHWVIFFSCAYLTIVPLLVTYIWMNYRDNVKETEKKWDILLFTQEYPITCCIWWEKSKDKNSCRLPTDENAWTVHGIWPTKNGTMGPFYCKDIPFDENALKPILPELKKRWITVNNNGDIGDTDFWKHEWTKHGTCAIEDPVFDSELKYFELGLNWNKEWDLNKILTRAGITPSDTKAYSYSDFHDTIQKTLGFAPAIFCYHDEERNVDLIQEIRHCVTKSLTLTDCDKFSFDDSCPKSVIYYPASSNFSLP